MVLRQVADSIKRWFIAGLLVLVPAVVTYLVLAFAFDKVDSLLRPALEKLLRHRVPGLGILILLVLILLLGLLGRSVLGKRLFSVWEKMLEKMPLIRTLYSASKQMLETVTIPDASAYSRVALVEYPSQGIYALGFVAHPTSLKCAGVEGEFAAVFIPSTPTPFTGYVVMISKRNIFPLEMSVEEAVRFVVSGGMAAPELFSPEKSAKPEVHS